eukprot:COSAG01_NODE_171_length_23132_cov_53.865118_29_plen_116_part_00
MKQRKQAREKAAQAKRDRASKRQAKREVEEAVYQHSARSGGATPTPSVSNDARAAQRPTAQYRANAVPTQPSATLLHHGSIGSPGYSSHNRLQGGPMSDMLAALAVEHLGAESPL